MEKGLRKLKMMMCFSVPSALDPCTYLSSHPSTIRYPLTSSRDPRQAELWKQLHFSAVWRGLSVFSPEIFTTRRLSAEGRKDVPRNSSEKGRVWIFDGISWFYVNKLECERTPPVRSTKWMSGVWCGERGPDGGGASLNDPQLCQLVAIQ